MSAARAAAVDCVRVAGQAIPYTVRRMRRRRHVHLVVGDDGVVEIRTPWRYPVGDAESLVRAHLEWVVEARERAAARSRSRSVLADGLELTLLGEPLRLRLSGAGAQRELWQNMSPPPAIPAGGAGAIRCADGSIWREGARLHASPADTTQETLRRLVERWYRREARAVLEPWLHEQAARLGVRARRVSIRGQRSRWGSCSGRGTISLNWRLMLVPWPLAEYVLTHELCHLRHMNHSPAFWAMVAGAIPDHRARRTRLNGLQDSLVL